MNIRKLVQEEVKRQLGLVEEVKRARKSKESLWVVLFRSDRDEQFIIEVIAETDFLGRVVYYGIRPVPGDGYMLTAYDVLTGIPIEDTRIYRDDIKDAKRTLNKKLEQKENDDWSIKKFNEEIVNFPNKGRRPTNFEAIEFHINQEQNQITFV